MEAVKKKIELPIETMTLKMSDYPVLRIAVNAFKDRKHAWEVELDNLQDRVNRKGEPTRADFMAARELAIKASKELPKLWDDVLKATILEGLLPEGTKIQDVAFDLVSREEITLGPNDQDDAFLDMLKNLENERFDEDGPILH